MPLAVAGAVATEAPRTFVPESELLAGRLPVTEASVGEIAAIADVAVRNLWITQSYADLAARLRTAVAPDQTWCTFAVWASNTAGVSIRGEELPRTVTATLLESDNDVDALVRAANRATRLLRRIGLLPELQRSHVEHLVAEAIGQVSGHIAHGNTLVFVELAPRFVRFLDLVGGPQQGTRLVDVQDLERHGVVEAGDDPLIRVAFEQYLAAANAVDTRERAQHVLAGNIAAVLHEQQRLQVDIASAMDAGLLDVGAGIAGLGHRLVPAAIERRVASIVNRHVTAHVERLWQRIATATMMTLNVPGQTLHLHRDVPPIPGTDTVVPEFLRVVDQPTLTGLLATWDRTGGTAKGSGARDWADLGDRMNYIVNLFRSRQRDQTLTAQPFTSNELGWMIVDRVPPSV